MDELSLKDILSILKRRQKYFFITSSVLFAISLIFSLSWSNYRSRATVQIEQSYIPANITTPAGMNASDTMVAIADQRISQIEQKVTGLESLAEIISKFNLYANERESAPISALTGKMRKKIKLELVSSVISNPAAAMKETAEQLSAIAFSVSFDYSDPQIAQQVDGELITRFLDEDLKQRRTQAQETSAFLASQISQLEATMAEQEKAIAEFRAAHGESGAASLMFNQQANMTTSLSIQNIEAQIASNEGTQGNIKAQLATTEPYSRVIADGQVLTTPAIQLKALQAQYASLTAQYGPDHPDVIKARHQIQALKAQIGSPEESAALEAQIADVKTNLAAAEQTYGEEHPDVVSLKRQLKALEKKLAAKPAPTTSIDTVKQDADNPAYLQLVAQLMSAEEQHKALIAQHESLEQQQAKYEKNLADNPSADQQMAKLTRDYDNAQLRFRELKEKKMSADMMEQLEQGRKGQRLVVIDPPEVPVTTQPARMLLVLGGLGFSIMCGIASVVLVEMTNQSVHSADHLSAITGAMPLVVIPYIYTDEEANNPFRRWHSLSVVRESLGKNLLPVMLVAATKTGKVLASLWAYGLNRIASRRKK